MLSTHSPAYKGQATIKRQQPPPPQLPLEKAPACSQLHKEVADKGQWPWERLLLPEHSLLGQKRDGRRGLWLLFGLGTLILIPAPPCRSPRTPCLGCPRVFLGCPSALTQFPVLQHPPTRWERPRALTLPFQGVNLCGIPNFPVSLRPCHGYWGGEKEQSPGNAFPRHPKQPVPRSIHLKLREQGLALPPGWEENETVRTLSSALGLPCHKEMEI